MATSFDNKLSELEAQFRAGVERNSADGVRGSNGSSSPAPRRPRPSEMCFSPANLSSNSQSPGIPNSTRHTPVTPRGIWTRGSPASLSTPSPASLSTPSPSFRVNGATNDIFASSARNTPEGWNSTPSPVGVNSACDPWRPGCNESRQSGGSALSSPGSSVMELGLPRPGSSTSLGGFPLNGAPRQRQAFNLPCSPQAPKSLDSLEIEQKYTEIMKQNGILTINDQRIATELADLEQIGELGHGTCGHVVKMRYTKTSHVMAVKQMRRSGNCEENKRIIMDLDVVLKSHSCPYIVHCIGTFILTEEVWICMELMATCLDKLLKRLQEPIPERILGKVAVATVNALHYLKENHGVIHRDVKPSNILLDERGRIKLCDFGISGRLVDSKAKTRGAGCAAYLAPERIDPPDPHKPDYDIRADVWSFGLSLVELATGEFPYKNCKTDFEMLAKIMDEDPPLLPSGKGFSMDFRSFVSHCLTKDYLRRPKYQQLLEHNFITRYTSMSVDVASWYAEVSSRNRDESK